MSAKKLFLLDGHALVYRAHYAFIARPLINSKGVNTGAITGFLRTLIDILQNQKPTHIAVAFDPHGPTFRNDVFPAYKANRDAMPEDIGIALPYIRAIVEAYNIPIIEVPGYEADDAIGTIAKQAEKEGFEVFMVTPDKDYAQLVSGNIKIMKPARQGNGVEVLGEAEVLENWGIKRVEQVIDFLGLQGDAVDNIPGVPGIGPKTAAILLEKYDSVEGVIAHVDELKGKQQENVRQYADQALLSKQLATIHLEVPLTFDSDLYVIEPFDREKLTALFKELEFRTLATSILGENVQQQAPVQQSLFEDYKSDQAKPAPAPVASPAIAAHSVAEYTILNTPHDYQLVQTDEEIARLVEYLMQSNEVCFDTETTGVDANDCELVGMSFCVKAHEAFYVPVSENREEVLAVLEKF